MKIPYVNDGIYQRPKFVWLDKCKNCPSRMPACPETEDYLDAPFYVRMRSAFACAWRPKGYCVGYYKKMISGKDNCDPEYKNFKWGPVDKNGEQK